MNLAQAVIAHGDYTYSWLEVSPGPRVLADQVANLPAYVFVPRVRVRKMVKAQTGPMFDVHAEGNLELASKMLRVLDSAGRCGQRLTFAQVYQRIADGSACNGRGMYHRSHRILLWLCSERKVCRHGRHRNAVFWIDRDKSRREHGHE